MDRPDIDGALLIYRRASSYIADVGLLDEIEWQRRLVFEDFTETDLLRESAWVILCSGFREQTVRQVFDNLSLCFCDWESASAIIDADPTCRVAAMASFGNAMKLGAIIGVARYIEGRGFGFFKEAILADPLVQLCHLPYIGPITVWHLAKNLGLDVVKPDRHLVRVSMHFGFEGVEDFCAAIAGATGEQKKVIDLIVWRYVADNPRIWKVCNT